jgi:broad specificity phosphatase PhoE/orotate phosphoribosyltransferase
MKTRLIFVRHGEAEGNIKRLFQGWTDGELTEKGHLQAQRVSERLKDMDIDVVYSSNLKRTMQTAEYTAEIKQLPIIATEKLREIYGGDWENEPFNLLPTKWPEDYFRWEKAPHTHRMPNGETMAEFYHRLVMELEGILESNPGKNVCIFTHGTAIRALLCYIKGCTLDEMLNVHWCDNTALTIADYEDGKFQLIMEGDAEHLGDDLGTIISQKWWQEFLKSIGKLEAIMDSKLLNWLFETDAVRVCPENKPFWYTSGTIGPYYINTHFLYGSEAKANELLESIDEYKEDKLGCPAKVLWKVRSNYNEDKVFKGLIDEMVQYIKTKIDSDKIDYISGGERRDWFFSLMAAEILDKPHITIYKDMSAVITKHGATTYAENLDGANVLHIADLITEASSYERAWIPAIKNLNGNMLWSVVVVDRRQGGEELLSKYGVASYAMVSIDAGLFNRAFETRLINKGQLDMLLRYTENPRQSMKDFITSHPEFMENALNADEKTRERAKLCIEKGIYR